MFWELRCWSFIVVKQLTKPYTFALFKIGLSSWHVIEQSTCYKYQKKFEWKAAWGEGGECCWDYLQVLWHANAVSKSQACWKWYQDLPTISVGVKPRRSATLEEKKIQNLQQVKSLDKTWELKKRAVTFKDCVRQIAKVSLNLIPDYELFFLHHKSKAQAGCNILVFLFSSKPIAVKN